MCVAHGCSNSATAFLFMLVTCFIWKGAVGLTRGVRSSRSRLGSAPNESSSCATGMHHRVQWHTADDAGLLEFDAMDGETLRTAALRSGVVSPHNGRANLINCRGLGTCGTCAVAIVPTVDTDNQQQQQQFAPVEPKERNAIEQLRLSLPPGHGPSSVARSELRLACQVQVRGDVAVTKYVGFWGQGAKVATRTVPTQPLGSWEFVLDTKSPRYPKSTNFP
jgi:ferredoxin